MKFTIFQSSRIGPRTTNQDRLVYSYSKDAMLLIVADGMGGHANGEVAAEMAVQLITDAFQKAASPSLINPAKFLKDQIMHVHHMIDQYSQLNDLLESPRTTIVAAIVQFGMLYCAHVGDSRLYHYRNGHLLFRTEDHSMVQSMFAKGLISKDEMATHPYRHKVHNCLGGDELPVVDLADRQELFEGDTILLCTDGVWSAMSDEQIKHTLNGNIISHNISKLLDLAETASQEQGDNMSAIGLQWGDKQRSSLTVSTGSMPLGATTTIMNITTEDTVESIDADFQLLEQTPYPDGLLNNDITDEEIEATIAQIQDALLKSNRS